MSVSTSENQNGGDKTNSEIALESMKNGQVYTLPWIEPFCKILINIGLMSDETVRNLYPSFVQHLSTAQPPVTITYSLKVTNDDIQKLAKVIVRNANGKTYQLSTLILMPYVVNLEPTDAGDKTYISGVTDELIVDWKHTIPHVEAFLSEFIEYGTLRKNADPNLFFNIVAMLDYASLDDIITRSPGKFDKLLPVVSCYADAHLLIMTDTLQRILESTSVDKDRNINIIREIITRTEAYVKRQKSNAAREVLAKHGISLKLSKHDGGYKRFRSFVKKFNKK